MRKVRLATAWLDGCSGCHMSLLDLDEALLEVAKRVAVIRLGLKSGCREDRVSFRQGQSAQFRGLPAFAGSRPGRVVHPRVSTNSLSVPRTGRDGYTYAVECSGGEFTASARHLPAPEGSPIRYPNLAIDAQMQINEIN